MELVKPAKAEFFYYDECPECKRPLIGHSFDQYRICKNQYYELEGAAKASLLWVRSE